MKKHKKILLVLAAAMLVIIGINTLLVKTFFSGTQAEEVSYDEFLRALDKKNVDSVQQ